jgi:hypothetical protein
MKKKCGIRLFGQKLTINIVKKMPEEHLDKAGHYDVEKEEMILDGMQTHDSLRELLHHEMFECAADMHGCKYRKRWPDDNDLFIMTHTELSIIGAEVRAEYESAVKELGL